MVPSLPWPLFKTEIGLLILALGCLVFDLFLPDNEKRGSTLAHIAMAGLVLIFASLWALPNSFGTGLKGSFIHDRFTLFFKALFLLAAFFTLFMAKKYQKQLKRGHGEFVLLVLFSLVGMVFLVSAGDFLLFFVALETLSVSLYIMTAYLKDREASIEAGAKYLILGALSAAIFLYGLSFIYGATGETSYLEIGRKLAQFGSLPTAFTFGMVLVIASLGFKIAAVPFQFWAPDIYEGAPTPVTAYLAIGSKAAGFAALVRLLSGVFAPAREMLIPLLGVLAALTILYGNLGAIPQTNVKRLMGYSSIGHAGYLLIGLAAFSYSGKEAVLYYLLAYLFSTAGAFLVIVAVSDHFKTDDIREYAGLSERSPVLAAGMLLSLFSLAGVPPLAGFFSKFYVLLAGMRAGYGWLVVIGLLNVVTSLYYYLKIVKAMYFEKPSDPSRLAVSLDQKAMQYLSILGMLVLGVWQGPFVRLVESAFLKLPR